MFYLGSLRLSTQRATDSASATPPHIPSGNLNESHDEALRQATGRTASSLINQIVAERPGLSTPRRSRSFTPRAAAEGRLAYQLFISKPMPPNMTEAVNELWSQRIQGAQLFFLEDALSAPTEEGLFAVVRLALAERIHTALVHPLANNERPADVHLFSDPDTRSHLEGATHIARALTANDPHRANNLDAILKRRVIQPDYLVLREEIPQRDNLHLWQAAVSLILNNIFKASGTLRDSQLIEALSITWEQDYLISG